METKIEEKLISHCDGFVGERATLILINSEGKCKK